MTKDERTLATRLSEYDSVELHWYRSVNGKEYWKAKHDGKPLSLVKQSTYYRMDKRIGLISGEGHFKQLNVAQLKANLVDYNVKQESRKNKRKTVK